MAYIPELTHGVLRQQNKPMSSKPKLNSDQQRAVEHASGPLLVVAGAGTGKTRVITERVKYLIQTQKESSNSILALTFTEKASQEMLERIGNIMPLGYEEPWIYTFHAFADRVLKAEGLEIGLDPSYKIISGPEQWLLFRQHLFDFDLKYFRPLGNPTKFISAILKFISRLQDENLTPDDLTAYAATAQKNPSNPLQQAEIEIKENQKGKTIQEETEKWQELAHIYAKYQELKIARSKMDFGDLITWTVRLFKQRPNILHKYQQQFKHILVDEFQDTNYAQFELIKLLYPLQAVQEAEEPHTGHNVAKGQPTTEDRDPISPTDTTRSLLVVGDDSQSIYKFRGAAVSNILEFKKGYPDADMVTLIQNYRSTQAILDAAYELIQNNNPDTLEVKLGISKKLISNVASGAGSSANGNLTGNVTTKGITLDGTPTRSNAPKGITLRPEVLQTATLEDEVTTVINKIKEIISKEPSYNYKDFAILARANSHLDPFLLGLRQEGLPYQLVGNRGLYDREEIKNLLALLKILINPNDTINLYRTLNIATFKIEPTTIIKLLAQAKTGKTALINVIAESRDEKIAAFYSEINKFIKLIPKATPTEFIYKLIKNIGYLNEFVQEETIENQLCIKNLDIFLNKVKTFELEYRQDTKNIPNLVDLLDFIDLMIEAGDNPAQAELEDADTINLLTVHASKGLEFPVVFLINVTSDRFPTRDRKDQIEIPEELIKETLPSKDSHIQEERRLFYVGMTRAQKYLYITLATNYGGKRDKVPSGFIEETGLKIQQNAPKETASPNENSLFGLNSQYRATTEQPQIDYIPKFLSFTQISTYQMCPLQYKYSYILGIPTPPNHALSFGITIHNTLKDFHTRLMFKETISLDILLKIYENNWQPLGYLDEKHRKIRFEQGKQMLQNYYEINKTETGETIAIEKSFNIKIGETKFFGRIDRIDRQPNGEIEIIDYKTGAVKDQKEVDKDMQVGFYAIGAKEGLNINPNKLTLYYVEDNIKVTTTRTPQQLDEIQTETTQTITKIKNGDFIPTPGMQCKWCDYKDICPNAYKD